MLFAALTFWLLVTVSSAWGVHALWCRLAKPRVVNSILLPGTLVAQLGHVLGLLVTGNPVTNTALMGDDDRGEPQAEPPQQQRLPVVGSILTGLLPLAACAGCLYASARLWGGSLISRLSEGGVISLPQALPTSIAGTWELLRHSLSLAEAALNAVLRSDLRNWETLLFIYLAICLTVRMSPFEGHRRGAIGAIGLAGAVAAIGGLVSPAVAAFLEGIWPVLSFAVAVLLVLLLGSLLLTAVVGLVRIVARNE